MSRPEEGRQEHLRPGMHLRLHRAPKALGLTTANRKSPMASSPSRPEPALLFWPDLRVSGACAGGSGLAARLLKCSPSPCAMLVYA